MFLGDFAIVTQYLQKTLREVVCLHYWHPSFHLSAGSDPLLAGLGQDRDAIEEVRAEERCLPPGIQETQRSNQKKTKLRPAWPQCLTASPVSTFYSSTAFQVTSFL